MTNDTMTNKLMKAGRLSVMALCLLGLAACGGGGGGGDDNVPPTAGPISITDLAIGATTNWTPAASDLNVGDTLTCSIGDEPTNGTATIASDCSTGTYTHDGSSTTTDSFTYIVSDGTDTGTGVVSVTIIPEVTSPMNWTEYLSVSRQTVQPWTKTTRNSFSTTQLNAQLTSGDVICTCAGADSFDPTLGNNPTDTLTNYMIKIATPEGLADYISDVYDDAIFSIGREVATGNTAYWMLGNEINSGAHSDSWQPYAPGTQTGNQNDQSYIPTFAEAWMGPAIEAVHQAEAFTGRDIKLILGSITNVKVSPAAQAWANALLDYEFVGTYAPNLAGLKVRELVQGTAFHYSVMFDTWAETIAFFQAQTVASPGIVFDTEEIGNQQMNGGIGPMSALRLIARTLKSVVDNQYNNEQFRLNIWSETQSYALDAGTMLFDWLGDGPVSFGEIEVTADQPVESYVLQVGAKRVALVITDSDISNAVVTGVRINSRAAPAQFTGDLHVFRPDPASLGLITSSYTANGSGGYHTISLNETLPGSSVMMFTIP